MGSPSYNHTVHEIHRKPHHYCCLLNYRVLSLTYHLSIELKILVLQNDLHENCLITQEMPSLGRCWQITLFN